MTISATLVRAAIARTRSTPDTRLQLKLSSPALEALVDVVCLPWATTYVLDLPEDPEALRFGNSRNHSRIRWAVKKAEKMDVAIRPAETKTDLRTWYQLYLETMRWHAVPPRPFRFFECLWEVLRARGLMRLVLAEQRQPGKPCLLAGSIFLGAGRTVCYAFNGRRPDALWLRPNDLIQWWAIHDACRGGFRRFDFGEVAEDGRGLAAFKAKWGGEEKALYRCYYPAPREVESGLLARNSAVRRLGESVWRRLPLRATAFLGTRLYRYL